MSAVSVSQIFPEHELTGMLTNQHLLNQGRSIPAPASPHPRLEMASGKLASAVREAVVQYTY